MRTIIRNATRFLFGFVVATTAACSGGSDATAPSNPPPSDGNVAGGYALTQVRTLGNLGGGGSGLPVTFVDGGGRQLVFHSGTLILGSDGAFDLTVQSTYQGGSVELRDYGHYEVAGANVTFHSDRSTPRLSTGSISGNTLTAQSQFGGIPFEIELVK